jgi:hypothetical protein
MHFVHADTHHEEINRGDFKVYTFTKWLRKFTEVINDTAGMN